MGILACFFLAAALPGAEPARGPLRRHPDNPRYFSDPGGRAVYLTGAHTWTTIVDMGPEDPPPRFDFEKFLRWAEGYGHNFIRLWTWDLTNWEPRGYREVRHHAAPLPYARTGPGKALDGKPKFDLTKYDRDYFRRLETRIRSAGRRGFYVSVMLFEGWGLQFSPGGWEAHPYHPENNVNGIDGKGLAVYTLADPKVTALQEAYVRKVVDTVNGFDNVLYEISNENHPGSTDWQYHMIRFVQAYEKTKPKQHPVGMTFQYKGGTNQALLDSPADWISPNPEGGFRDEPPPNDGTKVILNDTDHLWGIGGNADWVWKTFLRGMYPLFMDPYDARVLGKPFDPEFEPVRRNLGYTREYARRVNLAAMQPAGELASSRYCVANPGREYLVFVPGGGPVTVDLLAASGQLKVEWLDPANGVKHPAGLVAGGAWREFTPPFAGSAVLYLLVYDSWDHAPEAGRPCGPHGQALRVRPGAGLSRQASIGPALRGPVRRRACRRHRIRHRRLLCAAWRDGARSARRPCARQSAGGAVVDLHLRADRRANPPDALLVPAPDRRAGPDAGLQHRQRLSLLHPGGGDDLGLRHRDRSRLQDPYSAAHRHPPDQRRLGRRHTLARRRLHHSGHPRLREAQPLRPSLLALDLRGFPGWRRRHASAPRRGAGPLELLGNRHHARLERSSHRGPGEVSHRPHRFLRLVRQPRHARRSLRHGPVPLRPELGLRAVLGLRHVPGPHAGLDLLRDHGGGGEPRNESGADGLRSGWHRRRFRRHGSGMDDGEPDALPRRPGAPGRHELAALEDHAGGGAGHRRTRLLSGLLRPAARLRGDLRPGAHARRGDCLRRALDLPAARPRATSRRALRLVDELARAGGLGGDARGLFPVTDSSVFPLVARLLSGGGGLHTP